MHSTSAVLIAALILLLAACTEQPPAQSQAPADTAGHAAETPLPAQQDSALAVIETDSLASAPKPPAIVRTDGSYYLLRMKDSGKAVLRTLSPEMRTLVYKLNRRDAANMSRADSIIVPREGSPEDIFAYSPFPAALPELETVNKIVFFSYPVQAFAAYERGRLVRWGPTSMGKKSTPTPTGLFFSNWKAKESISTVDDEWKLKWNFNISNKGGVGWHEYAMPGYPASHSCLRLFSDDAQWLYGWADQWKLANSNTILAHGTPTIVFGQYAWGAPRPWLHLLEDDAANMISAETLREQYGPRLEEILQKQKTRESVLAATDSLRTAIQ